MIKNKILFAITILMLFGFSANSQSSGVSFSVRGGFNMQNINGKDMSGDQLKLSMVPRFNVGIVAEIPVAPEFYFQPGLLFATKGAKSKDKFLGMDMSVEYNLSYIELPLNLLYKPLLGPGHLLLGFGPYLAYGIGGKAKYTINGTSSEEKIEFAKEHNLTEWNFFKPFDYGANLFFGYELTNGFSLQLNTQFGLAKINSDNTSNSNDKTVFKNTGYGLSLGYRF